MNKNQEPTCFDADFGLLATPYFSAFFLKDKFKYYMKVLS